MPRVQTDETKSYDSVLPHPNCTFRHQSKHTGLFRVCVQCCEFEGPSQISDNKMARFYQLIPHCIESFGMSVLQALLSEYVKHVHP